MLPIKASNLKEDWRITHITMNPVAVNIQCHSARRAKATFTPGGVKIGF